MLIFYYSNFCGNCRNIVYPNVSSGTRPQMLQVALAKDYTAVKFKNYTRNKENFESADALILDVDNSASDNPDDWMTAEKLKTKLPEVHFIIHYSRNHMKGKDGKSPRPKFHVIFPLNKTIKTAARYEALATAVVAKNSNVFDSNALDAARFFFGTENPQFEIVNRGRYCIDEIISDKLLKPIFEGYRNNTLHTLAVQLLTKYGDCAKSVEEYEKGVLRCIPPMKDSEAKKIWNSALKFYNSTISQAPGYVKPEEYKKEEPELMPANRDFTDVGEAGVFVKKYGETIAYNDSVGWLNYRGGCWQHGDGVEGVAITKMVELTDEQLTEAKTAEDEVYQRFVIRRRSQNGIAAVVKLAKSKLHKPLEQFDADPFLLATPTKIYDLRLGLDGARENTADALCIKRASVDAGDPQNELWQEFLRMIFRWDPSTSEYVQTLCGMALFGRVFAEKLVISYGSGRNGKSTFWDTVGHELGSYCGSIAAEILTNSSRSNPQNEIAELRGRRLVIASETDESKKLSEALVKQLTSTDKLHGCLKFHQPFDFEPSHTLVLHTNHLPSFSGTDDGIARRLLVIPFTAKIEGDGCIQNYSAYLRENAKGSALAWCIEGAKKAYNLNFNLDSITPQCVLDATNSYKSDNDWLSEFLSEHCVQGSKVYLKELYSRFNDFCLSNGTRKVPNKQALSAAFERAGFQKLRDRNGIYFSGIELKSII